ncbi:NUDIX hydrolase [Candidatus Enterococcus willemsii]|uniref:NUDIX hydrolase n=1 Tax=Candidatus Enterococcus willemsii TaxID=1857215 RepID=A0ABQ6Z1A7_9ENTE|nr:NUDIX hydrolase [Enterococcus sp. CU12B]KAF1305149.1 NUDIX hydrolase [Enterococcus sp. CU12B]
MEKPIFGKKEDGKTYKARYGAYVVIHQDEKVIIVQAPNGAYFLPGGEIEANETHQQAIEREMLEEVGFEVEIGQYLGEGLEYFYSSHRDTYFEHPGYFYVVDAWKKVAEPTETTNELAWVTPEDALLLLKRGSHRWAIQEWLKQRE